MNSRFNNKTAPDGTQILQHDALERQTGIPDQDTVTFRQAREAAYTELFGEPLSVSHELLPQIPHIDVYTFKRTSKRPEGDQFVYPLQSRLLLARPTATDGTKESPASATKRSS